MGSDVARRARRLAGGSIRRGLGFRVPPRPHGPTVRWRKDARGFPTRRPTQMTQILICPNGHPCDIPHDAAESLAFACPVCGADTSAESSSVARVSRTTRRDELPPPPKPISANMRPTTIPGYTLLEELGQGGMGIVFKAWQQSLNRVVALKMIQGGSRADPIDLAR